MGSQLGTQCPMVGSSAPSSTQSVPMGQVTEEPMPLRRHPAYTHMPSGQPEPSSETHTPPGQSATVPQAPPMVSGAKAMVQRPVPGLQTKPRFAHCASAVQLGTHALVLVASVGSLGEQL